MKLSDDAFEIHADEKQILESYVRAAGVPDCGEGIVYPDRFKMLALNAVIHFLGYCREVDPRATDNVEVRNEGCSAVIEVRLAEFSLFGFASSPIDEISLFGKTASTCDRVCFYADGDTLVLRFEIREFWVHKE